MSKKLRICLVSMQRVFETVGGIEGYTKNLCRLLDNSGFKTYIVSRSTKQFTPWVQTDCSKDFINKTPESHRKLLSGSEFVYLVTLIVFSFLLFLRLLYEIRNKRLEIIHAQDPFFSGLPSTLAGRLTRRPAIVHCHGSHSLPTRDKEKTLSWFVFRIFYRLTTMIGNNFLATDSVTKSVIISDGVNPDQCAVIPTFVSKEFFSVSPRIHERIRLPFSLGYVGRLAKVKRVDTLIEATRLLKEKNIEVKVLIVGTGNERTRLIDQVTELALEENLAFLGSIRNASRFLEMIDVFVLPSESEGCPLALLESLAAGVPSVVSDIQPIRDMFDDSEVGFFNVGDASHLASVIEEILRNETRWNELSVNGRKKAELFSSERITVEMSTYYRSILRVNNSKSYY